MDYLIRLIHIHETFRVPELRALAAKEKVELEILAYSEDVCSPIC